MVNLEAKFDRMNGSPPGKGILPTPEHVVSAFRIGSLPKRGDSSSDGYNFMRKYIKF
jgi:hypothetical protein